MKTIPYVTLFLSLRNRFHKSILIKAFSLCNRNLFFLIKKDAQRASFFIMKCDKPLFHKALKQLLLLLHVPQLHSYLKANVCVLVQMNPHYTQLPLFRYY